MRTPNWIEETIVTIEGVKYVLHFEPEHICPRNHFINECDWTKEKYKGISDYYWFCARIDATVLGTVLGSTYLGGNCYATKQEVMLDRKIENILSGYAPQLIEELQEEIQEKVLDLKEKALNFVNA